MIADQLAFLESQEMVRIIRPEKVHEPNLAKPFRRNFTIEEHRRVIWLRFGTLDNRDCIRFTSKVVFQMTGVRPSSQNNIIRRWERHNFKVVEMK